MLKTPGDVVRPRVEPLDRMHVYKKEPLSEEVSPLMKPGLGHFLVYSGSAVTLR